MAFFNVDVLTPSKVVIKNFEAETLYLPSVKGETNVLPEHTHLVSKLDIGILSLKGPSGDRNFVVDGGVFRVLNKKVTVLASSCQNVEDINVEKTKEEKLRAQERLAGKEHLTDQEFKELERVVLLSEAKLRATSLK